MPGLIDYHYKFYGDRSRPLIIFLHGFMGSGEDWSAGFCEQKVISHLPADFCCLTIDLPFHGKTHISCSPETLTFEIVAEELVNLFVQLKISRCYLVGYSMGGRLGLYMALHHPGLFRAVALESASPGLKTPQEREARIVADQQRAEKLRTGDFREFLTQWYQQPLFQKLPDHSEFDNLLNRRLKNRPEQLADALAVLGTGRQPSLWKKLPHLSVPCLLIAGEKDGKYVTISKEMCNRNDSICLEIVKDCSHNVHFQKPGEFAGLLRSFFKQFRL